MTKTRITLLAVAITAALTACIPVQFQPGAILSSHPDGSPYTITYPIEGPATDWLWLSVPSGVGEHVSQTTGSTGVAGRVCFPTGETPRGYAATGEFGQVVYSETTASTCTNWIGLAQGSYSYGDQRFAVMRPGETFEIEMRVFGNQSEVAVDALFVGKIASEDGLTVYHEF